MESQSGLIPIPSFRLTDSVSYPAYVFDLEIFLNFSCAGAFDVLSGITARPDATASESAKVDFTRKLHLAGRILFGTLQGDALTFARQTKYAKDPSLLYKDLSARFGVVSYSAGSLLIDKFHMLSISPGARISDFITTIDAAVKSLDRVPLVLNSKEIKAKLLVNALKIPRLAPAVHPLLAEAGKDISYEDCCKLLKEYEGLSQEDTAAPATSPPCYG